MERTTLFIGLTREVTFAGLPIMYLVVLIMISLIGFIMLQSFVYVVIAGSVGYAALRALAAYDPKIIDVFLAAVKVTPIRRSQLTGKGVTYRA